jgi:hypothetical protein
MVGGGPGRVKLALVLAAALALSAGCFSRSYGRLAATHVEVLTAMARKGADLVAGGRLTAESMPELTYPLERAQAFARRAARRGPASRPSLVAFEALLARYVAFVDALDRVRRERTGGAARAALAAPLAAVEAAGREVVRALEVEEGGRTS